MKIAILLSLSNLEIANQFMKQQEGNHKVTLYYEHGPMVLKQNNAGERPIYNKSKMALLKDIRSERFDDILLAELPQTNIRILPDFLVLVLLSGAKRKLLLLENLTYMPLTLKLFLKSIIQLTGSCLKVLTVLPLVITNLVLLVLLCCTVDLFSLMKSKRAS